MTDEERKLIEDGAELYKQPLDFCTHLYELLTDKSTFDRALRMFTRGQLQYADAIGDDAIDIAEVRRQLANNYAVRRYQANAERAATRRKFAFYDSCERAVLKVVQDGRLASVEFVLIDNGRFVAFGCQTPNGGGIYAAHNDHESFNWNLHEILCRMRNTNRAFYRRIKKMAFAEAASTFDMSQHTIRKQ